MLLAAGFAPMYQEARLDAPELGPARRALDLILRHQEPYPAVVMNRYWDIVDANGAAKAFFGFLLEPVPASSRSAGAPPPNVVRLIFDPAGLRPWVTNWESVAEGLVHRVHRESVGGYADAATKRLLAEVLAYPGVPKRWRALDPSVALTPFIPVSFAKDGRRFDYFSTVTTLGTPQDITLQELRVECFFPTNVATEREAASLRQ